MNFTPGTVLTGKWTGETFKVRERLGEGANGAVYLVYTARGLAALKVCPGASEVALEWGTLAELEKLSGFPKAMLIDDCEWRGVRHFFYVMEWIPGEPFDAAIWKGRVDTVSAATQWLARLDELHRNGKAFCDLKPQNVLVTDGGTPAVRFVDVGGVTPFGRSVRQFTPTVDRAFWGLGSRTADASYDLVAVALSLLQLEQTVPTEVTRWTPDERKRWLGKALKRYNGAQRAKVLDAVFAGRVATASQFAQSWKAASLRDRDRPQRTAPKATPPASMRSQPSAMARHRRQRKPARDWSEWLMWYSLSLAVIVTGFAWVTAVGWFK